MEIFVVFFIFYTPDKIVGCQPTRTEFDLLPNDWLHNRMNSPYYVKTPRSIDTKCYRIKQSEIYWHSDRTKNSMTEFKNISKRLIRCLVARNALVKDKVESISQKNTSIAEIDS